MCLVTRRQTKKSLRYRVLEELCTKVILRHHEYMYVVLLCTLPPKQIILKNERSECFYTKPIHLFLGKTYLLDGLFTL